MENLPGIAQLLPWPPQIDAVMWVALVLVGAGLLGEAAFRWLRLPRVLGYAAIGMLAALFGLGASADGLTGSLRVVVDIALGLMLFELGARIDLRWLRANPWLLVTSVAEGLLTFALVAFALGALGVQPGVAVACGAIAMTASPATIMRISAEFGAAGQVTDRTMVLTGLNTLYAVIAAKLVTGWLHADLGHSMLAAVGHPAYLLLGSAALAALLALAVGALSRRSDLQSDEGALLLLGLILLALAITRMTKLSTLLVPLLAGMMLKNATDRPWVWPRHFGTAGGVLALMLFVITGSSWSIGALLAGGLAGIALVLARACAKWLVTVVLARPSGASTRQGVALGAAMMPLSATALVLLADIHALYPAFGAQVGPIVVSAVAVLELLGPAAVHVALRWVREEAHA